MALEKHPFQTYGGKQDIFTVKFDKEFTREYFDESKHIIQQEKDSTAIKQLAIIGSKVIREEKNKKILEIILNNYRKNKRLGIVTFD